MSASEKLKALEDRFEAQDPNVAYVSEQAVLEALPQIVAVVEQIERVQYAVEPLTTPETPLRDALSALDEALS